MKHWSQRRSGYSVAGWLSPWWLSGSLVQFLTAAFLFTSANLHAAQAVQAWIQRYDNTINAGAAAQALAVTSTGNIYVTGGAGGTSGFIEFATIAYSNNGIALWTNGYAGPINSQASAIGLDPVSGIVYISGESDRSNPLEGDVVTIAYTASGAPLWTNRYNAPRSCCASITGLAVGSNGAVYVGGSVGGMDADFSIVAYSSKGMPLWTNRYNGPANGIDALEALTVGVEGNVYVTGFSSESNSVQASLTIAYTSAGFPLWTNRYKGPAGGNDVASAITAANNGDVVIAIHSDGIGTGKDFSTVAYTSAGSARWTNRYNGPGNADDLAAAIAIDRSGSGNVYVTGASVNSNQAYDYATVAYSSGGLPLWTNRYGTGGTRASSSIDLSIDGAGNVIVTGWSDGIGTGMDYATVAYSSAGAALWTNRYNGPFNLDDGAGSVATAPDRSVYMAGISYAIGSGVTNADFLTIKYVPAPDIVFTKVQPLPGAGLRLTISAPTNTPYRLEFSKDLAHWQTLTNFPPLPFQRNRFTDPAAPGNPRRFYRTVWSP